METEKLQYLLLLSLKAENARVGKAVMNRVRANVDSGAAPLWIDAHGVGLFIETALPAWRIWQEAYPDSLPLDDRTTMKDAMLLQVGPGWYARDNQTTAAAWMHARFPRQVY